MALDAKAIEQAISAAGFTTTGELTRALATLRVQSSIALKEAELETAASDYAANLAIHNDRVGALQAEIAADKEQLRVLAK